MRKYGLLMTGLALALCLLAPLGHVSGAPAGYNGPIIVNTTDDDVDGGGCWQPP